MYHTWAPIHGRTLTKENRHIYLDALRRSECSHIVIVPVPYDAPDLIERYRDHVAYFTEHGIETGLWIGTTIGHSEMRADASYRSPFTPIVDFDGTYFKGTYCPLDPDFRKSLASLCVKLAQTGSKTILLDDDFRLSRRPGGGFFCTCDRHMEEMYRLCGTRLSKEEFRERIFSGKANPYRDAWLKAEGDSLRLLARELRAAVDEVDPSVRLALCSAHSLWDVDGADGLELAELLAGKNPPLLRLHGAPYWHVLSLDKDLLSVLEIARMFASFREDRSVEIISEGDVYPRPRYNVPAAYLELFDAALRADGAHDGILKYMFDYHSTPQYETGYVDHHCADLPILNEITRRFGTGADLGVRVHIAPNRFQNADLDLDPTAVSDQSPYPSAGIMLEAAGIPTLYGGKGFCDAAFGEEGQYVDPACCPNGLVLDAVAAVYLARRGSDVGICEESFQCGSVSRLCTHAPDEFGFVRNGKGRFYRGALKEGAEVLEYAELGGETIPLVCRYENRSGQRFLLCLFSGSSLHRSSGILRSYLHGATVRAGVAWLTRRPLPVVLPKAPELFSLVKEDGERRTLLLCNCFPDRILSPVFTFDQPYESAEFFGCSGKVEHGTVTLDEPLPPFSIAVISLSV